MNCRKIFPEPRVYNITEFSDYIEANPPSKIIYNSNDQSKNLAIEPVSMLATYSQMEIPKHSDEIILRKKNKNKNKDEDEMKLKDIKRIMVWPEYSALGAKVEVYFEKVTTERETIICKIILTVD